MIRPSRVIDFGAGDGFYGKLLKYVNKQCYVLGVEKEASYIKKFRLKSIYDELIHEDLIKIIDLMFRGNTKEFELAIFGDVLEHLEYDDFKKVLSKSSYLFDYIIINSPNGFHEQDHEIESEIHRCGITKEDFVDYNVVSWQEFKDGNTKMFHCLIENDL